MGVDHVIEHREPFARETREIYLEPSYVTSLNKTEQRFSEIIDLIKPRGHIALIDDPAMLDIHAHQDESSEFQLEVYVCTLNVSIMRHVKQHELLNRISILIDDGDIISTVTSNLGKLSVETLKATHVNKKVAELLVQMYLNTLNLLKKE